MKNSKKRPVRKINVTRSLLSLLLAPLQPDTPDGLKGKKTDTPDATPNKQNDATN